MQEKLSSPDWMLAGFDTRRGLFQFARVSRQTYAGSAFLDHRIQPRPAEVMTAGIDDVDVAIARLDARPAACIFHTAFCASTLLASCLDHPSNTLVLREPLILSRLADWYRKASPEDRNRPDSLQQRVFRLLDRRYAAEAVLVKPSNYANVLIPAYLDQSVSATARRCVLLSNGLRSLLISVLKKADEARDRMPGFTAAVLSDTDYQQRVDLPHIDSLDLLQQSVVFWHCQRYHFQVISRVFGPEQVLPVSTDSFMARPRETLVEISHFLQLGLNSDQLTETVQSGAFQQHSKTGDQYGPEQKHAESDEITGRYAAEIQSAMDWARPLLNVLPPQAMNPEEDPLS